MVKLYGEFWFSFTNVQTSNISLLIPYTTRLITLNMLQYFKTWKWMIHCYDFTVNYKCYFAPKTIQMSESGKDAVKILLEEGQNLALIVLVRFKCSSWNISTLYNIKIIVKMQLWSCSPGRFPYLVISCYGGNIEKNYVFIHL